MLSDLLANTIEEIDRYVSAHPECYGEPVFAAQLQKARTALDDVRNKIDSTPSITGQEQMARAAGRI